MAEEEKPGIIHLGTAAELGWEQDSEPPKPLTSWERADRAGAALQAHVDEVNGMPGVSYGDEGSDTFVEAVVELLVDLKHLLWRTDHTLMLEDLAAEAIDRWSAEDDEVEG